MLKRVTWFVAGAVSGAGGSMYARRRLRLASERYRPVAVARTTAGKVKRRAGDVGAAVQEGRAAMRQREAELRAALIEGKLIEAGLPDISVEGAEPPENRPTARRGPRRRARR